MNNIELDSLKKDVIKYLGNQDLAEKVGLMRDGRLNKLKQELEKIKDKEIKSNQDKYRKRQLEKRIKLDFEASVRRSPQVANHKDLVKLPKTKSRSKSASSESTKLKVPVLKSAKRLTPKQAEDNGTIVVKHRKIVIPANRKPRILVITDVKNWAWWIKGEYLQKYLSDEFDIDLVCVLGPECINKYQIPTNKYDFYFTFGYSYIDSLYNVPKFKKSTGVTAHRARNVLIPKMKQAGHLHANSMMLYRELIDMGFEKVYYIPNGVNEELFRIVKPIPEKRDKIVVGHVGKECPAKGQAEIIYPAIKQAGGQRVTNVSTWKDKIPHDQMYKIYQEMDVFVVASLEDGTPNPALEAASCGRPIISNKIGNMPEFIKDGYNGFLVGRTVAEYVDKIKWLQDNRSKMINMGLRARETIEKYWTWEIQAENYRKMFRDIFVKKE
jgi:glycosyltransferase involved in cell wall biosynthesis